MLGDGVVSNYVLVVDWQVLFLIVGIIYVIILGKIYDLEWCYFFIMIDVKV